MHSIKSTWHGCYVAYALRAVKYELSNMGKYLSCRSIGELWVSIWGIPYSFKITPPSIPYFSQKSKYSSRTCGCKNLLWMYITPGCLAAAGNTWETEITHRGQWLLCFDTQRGVANMEFSRDYHGVAEMSTNSSMANFFLIYGISCIVNVHS